MAFVNLTKMHYLHKICKVSNSTVMVSLAVQPGCVYRDINMKWGGGGRNPMRSLLVHNMGWGSLFLQPHLLILRPLVIDALF